MLCPRAWTLFTGISTVLRGYFISPHLCVLLSAKSWRPWREQTAVASVLHGAWCPVRRGGDFYCLGKEGGFMQYFVD